MKTVIDIGTNSVRFLSDNTGHLVEQIAYTRIGEGIDHEGNLAKASYLRTLESIKAFLFDMPNESSVTITATSAIREAINRDEVLGWFYRDLGHEVCVLSEEEEAKYNYLGVTNAFGGKPLVLDIGGGSTELISSNGAYSLPIGAMRLKDKPEHFMPLEAYLSPFSRFKGEERLIGTGGTITTLAFLLSGERCYHEEKVNGRLLTHESLKVYSDKLVSEEVDLSFLPEKRRDILQEGLSILLAMLEVLEKSELLVSTKDGLYGLYYSHVTKKECFCE